LLSSSTSKWLNLSKLDLERMKKEILTVVNKLNCWLSLLRSQFLRIWE
jgi:hypothetical protein